MTARAAAHRATRAALAAVMPLALVVLAPARARAEAPAPASAPGSAPAPGQVSPVVYPPQTLALRYSHARHAGVACARCHAAAGSRAAADRLLPTEAACTGAGCHAIDRALPDERAAAGAGPTACAACHPGWASGTPPARTVIPPPNLKFSHTAHVARAGCASCHGDLSKRSQVSRADLPRMASCLRCHDGRAAASACTTCHLGLPDGRMRVNFPEGTLRPTGQMSDDAHDLGFARTHGRAAATDAGASCASCHKPKFCEDCHAGEIKPRAIHPGDYVTIHALEARKDAPSCAACHTRQIFCVGCHQRTGVASETPGGPFSRGARFHPATWTAAGRGPGHHAWEAQRNLATCSSCHRESTCMRCHSARPGLPSAASASPHPRGFGQQPSCQALASRNPRTCLKCHDLARSPRILDCIR